MSAKMPWPPLSRRPSGCLLRLLLLLLIATSTVSSKQIVLKDTNVSTSLQWNVWKLAEQAASDGWVEETYTDAGRNQRVYVSCNLDSARVENWLFTPLVKRKEANRIHITVRYSLRDCPPERENARQCKEYVDVFYRLRLKKNDPFSIDDYVQNGDINRKEWMSLARLAGKGGEEHKLLGSADAEMTIATESFVVTLAEDAEGVLFAFKDEGACASLLNISIFYEVCEASVLKLAAFPETPVGKESHTFLAVHGECVENAEGSPVAVCASNANWSDSPASLTPCSCKAGFYNANDVDCLPCPPNHYSSKNATECARCPANSFTPSGSPRQRCRCREGTYRLEGEDGSMPCRAPPTKPAGLHAAQVTATTARLEWLPPTDATPDVPALKTWYRWQCANCPSPAPRTAEPVDERPEALFVVLEQLTPNTTYTIAVYAENEISALAKSISGEKRVRDYGIVEFTTRPGYPIRGPFVEAESGDEVTIGWEAPATAKKAPSGTIHYDVLLENLSPAQKAIRVTQKSYSATGFRRGQTIVFKVRSVVEDSEGVWSEPLTYIIGQGVVAPAGSAGDSSSPADSSNPWSSIGLSGSSSSPSLASIPLWVLALAALLLLILVAFAAAIFRRRSKNRKQMSDLDVLDTYKQDTMTPDYNSAHRQPFGNPLHECFRANKLNAPLIPPYGDHTPKGAYGNQLHLAPQQRFKPYVDPTAYEDPNVALSEFAFDIDPSAVCITSVIGGGEFGDVCMGHLNRAALRGTAVGAALVANGEREQEAVAIKTLKPGSGAKAKADFLLEASIMGQFAHPSVIRLIGVVTRAEPVMIVTEYMSNGSLDHFLRTRDAAGDELLLETLLRMLAGIASGMRYLTEKGFVHRDLAARNVLVDASLTCKIADFGLSRGVDNSTDQEYTTNGGKIPVRWTAPEAITHRKFTPASDVWSYGVVMWEVCSRGERPYWEWTNQKVISEIMAGYRLPCPMDTPPALHRVMLWCWQLDRHERPQFVQLLALLERYVAQPELVHVDLQRASGAASSIYHNTSSPPSSSGSVVPCGSGGIPCGSGSSNARLPPHAPPPAPPLDELLRSLGLGHAVERLAAAGVRHTGDLARMSHLEMLAAGLISEEYQRIRDALLTLRTGALGTPVLGGAGAQNRRPAAPPHYADTVATLPGRPANRGARGDDGFFV